MDTSGFYMYDNDLRFAPNFVCASHFELFRDRKDSYQYPVFGWSWFDSEADARIFFGLPETITETFYELLP